MITTYSNNVVSFKKTVFTSITTTDLVAWYKGDVPQTYSVDGSNYITQWEDQSGNGNHLTGSTFTSGQTYINTTTTNGLTTIGWPNNKQTPSCIFTTPITGNSTIYIVSTSPGYNPGVANYIYQNLGTSVVQAYYNFNGTVGGAGTRVYYTNPFVSNAQLRCMSSTYNGAVSQTGLTMGGGNGSVGATVCEFMYFNTLHNASRIAVVTDYLKTKWGV